MVDFLFHLRLNLGKQITHVAEVSQSLGGLRLRSSTSLAAHIHISVRALDQFHQVSLLGPSRGLLFLLLLLDSDLSLSILLLHELLTDEFAFLREALTLTSADMGVTFKHGVRGSYLVIRKLQRILLSQRVTFAKLIGLPLLLTNLALVYVLCLIGVHLVVSAHAHISAKVFVFEEFLSGHRSLSVKLHQLLEFGKIFLSLQFHRLDGLHRWLFGDYLLRWFLEL